MSNTWSVSGIYLEACNCESVCPCRSHDGFRSGDATSDTCDFALAWKIEAGHHERIDLAGRSVVITGWYADAEPGSPWRVRLYVDDRAGPEAGAALASIFLGRAGGHPAASYAAVITEVVGIENVAITLTHSERRWAFGVAGRVEVRASRRTPVTGPVVCGIPGPHPGTEYTADVMRVTDPPFRWDVVGRAAFVARFAYDGSTPAAYDALSPPGE